MVVAHGVDDTGPVGDAEVGVRLSRLVDEARHGVEPALDGFVVGGAEVDVQPGPLGTYPGTACVAHCLHVGTGRRCEVGEALLSRRQRGEHGAPVAGPRTTSES